MVSIKRIKIKKKYEKKLNRIAEFITILGVLMIIVGPLLIIVVSIWYEPIIEIFPYMFYGGLLCPLTLLIGSIILNFEIPVKKQEPFKYNIKLKKNETFLNYTITRLIKEKYILQYKTEKENYKIYIFYKKRNLKKLDLITIIETNDFEKYIIEELDIIVQDTFEQIIGLKRQFYYVYFIPIVIANKESKYFFEWLKNILYQDFKKFILNVGFCNYTKKLYISNQATKIGIYRYLELKKKFSNMILLKNIKK